MARKRKDAPVGDKNAQALEELVEKLQTTTEDVVLVELARTYAAALDSAKHPGTLPQLGAQLAKVEAELQQRAKARQGAAAYSTSKLAQLRARSVA